MFERSCFFLLISLAFGSCEKESEVQMPLYNVDSLISSQVELLSTLKTTTQKKATLDGKQSISTLQLTDTTGWKNELDIFQEIDNINKSVNRKAYQIEDGIPDTKSNLTIKSISTKEDLPVKYLRVYYHAASKKIRLVEASIQQSNSLYSSSKFFTLGFEDIHNKTTLTYYAIRGGQKMFMNDTVQYHIEAFVTIP